MKKIQISILVLIASIGVVMSAFTNNSTVRTNQWYGQTSDAVPPYDKSYPLTATQVNADCPTATQHICAVELDMNDNVVATRKSSHNFIP